MFWEASFLSEASGYPSHHSIVDLHLHGIFHLDEVNLSSRQKASSGILHHIAASRQQASADIPHYTAYLCYSIAHQFADKWQRRVLSLLLSYRHLDTARHSPAPRHSQRRG